ncbi:hypothetical protein ACFYT3_29325 [Nocardia amikacinitolerans]|uniref:hypothetical protein n=1 Tax=Nocardia amikacinitolerans TaxID=756689 RepID=UPI0020A53B1D|nr:hypothetical protein [Nocardia amikacinitolerans]
MSRQTCADAGQHFPPSHVVILDFLVEPDRRRPNLRSGRRFVPTELDCPIERRARIVGVACRFATRLDRTLESRDDD